jgi:hypothetical protein
MNPAGPLYKVVAASHLPFLDAVAALASAPASVLTEYCQILARTWRSLA